jgi:hypothetical protein
MGGPHACVWDAMNARMTKTFVACALAVSAWLGAAAGPATADDNDALACTAEIAQSACDQDLCEQECASGSAEGGTCIDDACVCQGCVAESCSYYCEAMRWDGGTCVDDACVCWG